MNWKKLGEHFKSATGVSVAAMLVLAATYGKQLVESAMAIPALYRAYAEVLPMGLWSALLGTALSAGFHAFARSWHSRSLAIEVASILLGTTVVAVQLTSKDPARLLSALIVGAVAGLAGLFISKTVRHLLVERKDEPRPNTSLPESD